MAKTRGSVKNSRRLDAFAKRSGAGDASWKNCDQDWVRSVVVAITDLGGAATFGLSRDRGAYSLTLLLDDTRETLWFNGDADLDDELRTVVSKLDAMA
ncbi:hypothetical protein LCGC14_2599390 [marine sediment metagenome]|uniref:Uncharacterized protein n=1 Tax=marine sediment metagenome TaxID=412755 RepID=A0A0F9D1X1_9ZZZZ